MVPNRVILSTDDNPDYIQFWNVFAPVWRQFDLRPTLVYVTSSPNWDAIDQQLGDVVVTSPLDGIWTGNQAQSIRLLIPSEFPDDFCVLSDIDLLPLRKSFFFERAVEAQDDQIVIYRNSYPHLFRYPINYVAAKGSTFEELFLANGAHWRDTQRSWYRDYDYGWFTDERMLYEHAIRFDRSRVMLWPADDDAVRRINEEDIPTDKLGVLRGHYVDYNCPRPYIKYKDRIDKVVGWIKEKDD